MGDENYLFDGLYPIDLFGQPMEASARAEVVEQIGVLTSTEFDLRRQFYLRFPEPEKDFGGNGMLFAGKVLIGDGNGPRYEA